MKRICSLALILLLLLGLTACAAAAGGQTTPSYDIQVLPADSGRESPASSPDPAAQESPVPDTQAPDPGTAEPSAPETAAPSEPGLTVTEDGVYDSKEEVALYIHLYRHLPSNYITKKQAEKLGWPGGDLRPYAPGKCIGGSHFGNYEGLLPDQKGREWTECDIDTLNRKSRGAKRIIFSNDGLIYYTDDHYESFELLYEGWED